MLPCWLIAYYVQKKGYNYIITLQSKNKNNAFKAEVKFTKQKIKIIQKHRLIE